MDWNVKRNLKYLLLIAVFCAIVPHTVLTVLQMKPVADSMVPATADSYVNFFVREWIPFWAVFIAYLRLQKMDKFSLLPWLVLALIIPTFIPRNEQNGILVLGLTLPLLLVIESFGLMEKMESSENVLLHGISTNRGLLRAFFFWTIAIPWVAHIACAGTNAKTLPFFLLPIPAVLLYSVFHQLKEEPPTVGGVVGMLLMVPVSLMLASTGPMAYFRKYHLAFLLVGYALIFVMQIVYHMDRWRKPKTAN